MLTQNQMYNLAMFSALTVGGSMVLGSGLFVAAATSWFWPVAISAAFSAAIVQAFGKPTDDIKKKKGSKKPKAESPEESPEIPDGPDSPPGPGPSPSPKAVVEVHHHHHSKPHPVVIGVPVRRRRAVVAVPLGIPVHRAPLGAPVATRRAAMPMGHYLPSGAHHGPVTHTTRHQVAAPGQGGLPAGVRPGASHGVAQRVKRRF